MGSFSLNSGGNRNRPRGIAGKIGATIFYGIFLAIGLVVTVLLTLAVYRNFAPHFWNKTDCLIIRSAVKEIAQDGGYDYRFDVAYRYTVNGRQYTGSTVSPNYGADADYRTAEQLGAAYPVLAEASSAESPVKCLVNPRDPQQAVLRPDSSWLALFIFIPLIFVAVGLFGIIAQWKKPQQTGDAVLPPGRRTVPLWGITAFGSVFLGVGIAVFVFVTWPEFSHLQQSQHWLATPCMIVQSSVRSHEGSGDNHDTTYSVDVLYRYQFKGKPYASSEYNFSSGSSSGYASKQETVKKILAGAYKVCYVNPADPSMAVLSRTGDVILAAIFPVAFGGAGLLVLIFRRRFVRQPAAVATYTPANVRGLASLAAARAPRALKPRSTPKGAFFGLLLFTLVWNVLILGMMAAIGMDGHHFGHIDPSSLICFAPFVLVGLLLIVLTIRVFLTLFNPTAAVTLNPGTVSPGESIQVKWRLDGRYDRIDRLHIEAICQRQVTISAGNNTHTTTTELLKIPVLETVKALEIPSGKAWFAIPAGVQPSQETGTDKILWSVRVQGHIQHWPAVDESFAFQVMPGTAAELREALGPGKKSPAAPSAV